MASLSSRDTSSQETSWSISRWSNMTSSEDITEFRKLSIQDLLREEKGKPPQTGPVGFWSSSLAQVRKQVLWEYSKTLLILCVFVFTVLSFYWGVLYEAQNHIDQLTVAVVDFDGQPSNGGTELLVGPAIVAAALSELTKTRHLRFQIESPARFSNDAMEVRTAVHNEEFWAAIVVNSNASALLQEAITLGNSSYDPTGAAQIIYNQARDQETYNEYIVPILVQFMNDFTRSFSRNWTSTVLTDTSLQPSVYSNAPQALSPAVDFSIFNLRPFGPATALPAVSVGLIYLIIIAFFSFGFFMPTHVKFVLPDPSSPHPPLKFHQLVIWRYFATIIAYLFMSLFYSLVSLALQIPFSNGPPPDINGNRPWHWPTTSVVESANYYHQATFLVYWMVNFVGMIALGLACENMAMLLGTPWTALWLIFWVIINVATGFYTLELAPTFYKWGIAFPLRQIVMASRTLLFGTKDRLAMNFGILLAWVAVGTILFPFCCWVLRWKTIQAKKKQASMPTPVASSR